MIVRVGTPATPEAAAQATTSPAVAMRVAVATMAAVSVGAELVRSVGLAMIILASPSWILVSSAVEWTRNRFGDQLTETFAICARPSFGRAGKTTALQANYFGLALNGAVTELFKFHVAVERAEESRYGPAGDDAASGNGDVAMADASAPAPRLPRRHVCNVINAILRDHESDFEGVRVVHDGMVSLYAPRMISWTT